MPANAGRIENNLRSAKSGHAGTFRIPLVPANLDADFAVLCFKVGETKIAGSEIKFFVIERIVWNMHFAVFAEKAAVRVEYGAGIVVDAGGAALKKRNYQDDFLFLGYFCKCFGGRAGNWLGEVEKIRIFLAQKYSLRKSSCNEMICAPRAAASRILSIARERFSSALVVQRICTRPTVNLFAMTLV